MSPCTWFVLFSFQRSLPPSETTILVYHLLAKLSTTFLNFFYIFLLFFFFFDYQILQIEFLTVVSSYQTDYCQLN